ncbi:MAG: hypothetical protein MJ247_06140 [Alphaproteobacteria bacterium]|nr:hypothetical protein [Alphaproteobacteria bacterium]
MEKENKLATEQETKENEIVELKDMSTITVGSGEQDIHVRPIIEGKVLGADTNVFNDNIFITSEAN